MTQLVNWFALHKYTCAHIQTCICACIHAHAEMWIYLKTIPQYQSIFSKEKIVFGLWFFFLIRSAIIKQGHVTQASCLCGLAAGYDSILPLLLKKSSTEFLHLTGNCCFQDVMKEMREKCLIPTSLFTCFFTVAEHMLQLSVHCAWSIPRVSSHL